MTSTHLLAAAALLLVLSRQQLEAFNVDVVNYVKHDGPSPDSMYGFSVALHKEKQTSWVLIGAPRADTSRIQAGVQNGGAVYRCDSNDDNRCWLVPFDGKGSWQNDAGLQLDTKSNQWFGATVASAGIDGPIVACAPRYVFHTTNPNRLSPRIEPVGTCFVARDNFQVFTEFSPCRTNSWGYHRQGSCQAGFSAAITNDRLFVGAPGSWYWQGQEYSINNQARYPYWPPKHAEYGQGQSFSHSIRGDSRDRVYTTTESSNFEDDTYRGYSTVAGDFNGDGQRGVASGMPRGGQLLGKVLLYSWNMTNLQNITGEQIGAYFGYSLCVVDVDGDKLDDLIIGAPMYTEPNNEGKYEMGRVYVMFQGKYNKFQELLTRDGLTSRGRFGLALSTLGDINQDGYGDFAVGAPYDGPRGRGAVHIYHGSAAGPLEKASQIIYAEDVMLGIGQPLSTFGFAVAGGIDLDGNQYPDMVVGAYESNKAITFKSRPVAVMEASTTFTSDSKLISLDDKRCQLRSHNGQKVACTVIHSCLKYVGLNLPTTLDIDISWVLDAKKYRQPRMFFVRDEGRNVRNSTMRLQRGKEECINEQVYLVDAVRDKLTPLEVEMKYAIRQQQPLLSRQPRSLAGPVLDQNAGTVQRDAINIQKNCGRDNVCVPDLRLDIRTVDKYLLGSKELLNVEVMVPNSGEDAFESAFYMKLPESMNFRKMENMGDASNGLITCTAPSAATGNMLKCDIGNPLPAGKKAHFKLVMMPAPKPGLQPSYDFYMEVNSTNAESNGTIFDNRVQKSVSIWVETDLSVTGAAVEPVLHYNASAYVAEAKEAKHEEELGPHVVNMFEIRNNGPSAIEESEVYVVIPHQTLAGESLVYLLNQPETSGNIRCEPTVMVNAQHLQLDDELVRTSFLESQGAVERGSGASSAGAFVGGSAAGSASASASSGSSSSSSSGGSQQRFGAADFAAASGDASHIHRQRQNQAASSASASGSSASGASGAGASNSWSSQSSSHSANGGPVVTYAASQNRSAVRGADGQMRTVFESSTELYSAGVGGGQYSANQQRANAAQASYNQQQQQGRQQFQQQNQQQQFQQNQQNQQNQQSLYNQQRQQHQQSQQSSAAGASAASAAGQRQYHQQQQQQSSASASGQRVPLEDIPAGDFRINSQYGSDASSYGAGQSSASAGSASAASSSASAASSSGGRRRMYSAQDGDQFGSAPRDQHLLAPAGAMEQAAQGGRGFVTHQLEVPVLARNNVDDELRQRGAQTVAQHQQQQQQQNQQHQSWNSGAGTSNDFGEDGDANEYEEYEDVADGADYEGEQAEEQQTYGAQAQHQQQQHHQQQSHQQNQHHQQQQQHSQSSASHSASSSSAAASGAASAHAAQYSSRNSNNNGGIRHYPQQQPYQRQRRQAPLSIADLELAEALQCNRTKCMILKCRAGPLPQNGNAWIAIRTRLVASTVHLIAPSVPMNISTMVVARVTKLPYIGAPQEQPLKRYEVVTTVIPIPEPKPDVVPLWVVVLSACAGVLILLLLIFLLYKCGFFNRNRPTDSQERQPLNRNNGYHGDEHL